MPLIHKEGRKTIHHLLILARDKQKKSLPPFISSKVTRIHLYWCYQQFLPHNLLKANRILTSLHPKALYKPHRSVSVRFQSSLVHFVLARLFIKIHQNDKSSVSRFKIVLPSIVKDWYAADTDSLASMQHYREIVFLGRKAFFAACGE